MRHSTAHLLAAAVTNLFPGTQCGIGPATDEGFFYDFIVPRPFVPEDLETIEKKMQELAREDLVYERQLWPREEAKTFFASRGEPLKVQLIEEKTHGQREVSCYTIKDKETFIDFCVGPHVPSTGKLKAFKLLSTSNAYWKGDARNAPMQRVYGTAFLSDKDLKAHLTQVEEAKKRDHRKLGRELGLFMFPCRLCRGEDPARVQQGAVGAIGPLEALPGEHVPHRVRRGNPERETDELPRTFSRVREPGAQLSRPAGPFSRADPAPSQRSVRRAVGTHARAAVFAGRRALLHHAGADRR
jgi:hypothetical protein